MVDTYGNWTEEDYTTYPKEKWCMYDYLAAWIRQQEYEVKTDIENLITLILLHGQDQEWNGRELNLDEPEEVIAWVKENGGLEEFDYYA